MPPRRPTRCRCGGQGRTEVPIARDTRWNEDRFRLAFVRLAAHYWSRDGFCDPPLLERMELLRGIPGVLIHGRRDISSPVLTAWELHRRSRLEAHR